MVFGRDGLFPEIAFSPSHSLIIHHVGVSTVQAHRYGTTVEDGHHPVLRQPFGKFAPPTHGNLVVAFEEINLGTRHPALVHLLDPIVRILQRATGPSPNQYLHVLPPGIVAQFLDVLHFPSGIERHVFYTVLRSPVYIVFIKLQRKMFVPHREVHAFHHGFVPPFPSTLSGLYPRGILNLARFGQHVDQLIVQQRPVVVGHDHDAPRERAVASRPCNVILT